MSGGKKSLYIEIAPDGDIIVHIHEDGASVQDDKGNNATVEFCNPTGGGGRSPHTRRAIFALFEAMRQDANEKPDGIPQYPVWLAECMVEVQPNDPEMLLNLRVDEFFTDNRMVACGVSSIHARSVAIYRARNMAQYKNWFNSQPVKIEPRPRVLIVREFITEYPTISSLLLEEGIGRKVAEALANTMIRSGLSYPKND